MSLPVKAVQALKTQSMKLEEEGFPTTTPAALAILKTLAQTSPNLLAVLKQAGVEKEYAHLKVDEVFQAAKELAGRQKTTFEEAKAEMSKELIPTTTEQGKLEILRLKSLDDPTTT